MNNMVTLLITKLFGKKAGEDHLGNKYFYRLVKNNKISWVSTTKSCFIGSSSLND